jgi:hypothetical protein
MAISIQNTVANILQTVQFPVRYPPTAFEIGGSELTAVRLRRDRTGRRLLGYGIAPLEMPGPGHASPASVLKGDGHGTLKTAVERAAESAGIRSGKASLILPDSLARVWLLQLPEIPRGHQPMLELIRWKIKRSVAFRIEDAVISWQILSRPAGTEPAVVLVGLLQGPVVHGYEKVFAAAGFKIGLVDLCSFNLFNAYRQTIEKDGLDEPDFALLNATEAYFTLMIFRRGNLIFYRCKTHSDGEGAAPAERERTFRRELATSLSYYTEKLKGLALAKTYARVVDTALVSWRETVDSLGFGQVETIDPGKIVKLPDEMDPRTAADLAPALGAAIGRGA